MGNPSSFYPATTFGYLFWRPFLKKRQADLASAIYFGCNFSSAKADSVAAPIRKDDLRNNEETQVLKDVACLVFLDDQLEHFEKELSDEEKMAGILQKTWRKMNERGRKLARRIGMCKRCRRLAARAREA